MVQQDGRKSLRRSKVIESKTLERKKKKHRLSSRSKSEKSLNEPTMMMTPVAIPSTIMTTDSLTTVTATSPSMSTSVNSTNSSFIGDCGYGTNHGDRSSSSEINTLPSVCFDENKEWAEIASIMASFGSDLTQSTEEYSSNQTNGLEIITTSTQGNNFELLDDWLKELHLKDYITILISNGFDNIQFMVSCRSFFFILPFQHMMFTLIN